MMTDEEILKVACTVKGCINLRKEEGYLVCAAHLYGKPIELPPGPARRKLELDAKAEKANREIGVRRA